MLEKHTLIHCSRQVFNHGTYSISSYCMLVDILPFDCLFDKCPSLPCVLSPEALEDSKASLSGCIPTLNRKMTQHLTERCFRFLKSASEVPRLYRRTNKVRRPAPQAPSSQNNGTVLPLGFNVAEMIREHLLYSTKILKSVPHYTLTSLKTCLFFIPCIGSSLQSLCLHGQRPAAAAPAPERLQRHGEALHCPGLATDHTQWLHSQVGGLCCLLDFLCRKVEYTVRDGWRPLHEWENEILWR